MLVLYIYRNDRFLNVLQLLTLVNRIMKDSVVGVLKGLVIEKYRYNEYLVRLFTAFKITHTRFESVHLSVRPSRLSVGTLEFSSVHQTLQVYMQRHSTATL